MKVLLELNYFLGDRWEIPQKLLIFQGNTAETNALGRLAASGCIAPVTRRPGLLRDWFYI